MTGPDRPVRQPANAQTSSLLTCNLRPDPRGVPGEWTWSSGEMRRAVLGAGGIGGLLAAAFARTRAEVTLLLRPETLDHVQGRRGYWWRWWRCARGGCGRRLGAGRR